MNATQSNFVSTGEYNNQFDEFGNLIIIEGSEKYLAVVLTDEVYDNNSVSNVFNVDIEEFKDVTPAADPKVIALESEKAILQKKVSSLTSQLAKSNPSEKDAIVNANKDIIISLRIKAGEGHVPSDFNTSFPYLPLYSTEAKQSDASGVNSSPVQQTSPTSSGSTTTTTTTSTTTTTQSSTSSSGESITSNLAVGDACPKQLDIQLVPPTEYKAQGPIPVLPVAISSPQPKPVTPPSVPIHQVAVQSVAPVVQNTCVEKFYPYGKYAGVWESLGLQTSPLISNYGVYSTKVTESYALESSDTLSYQVYIPSDGEYTFKFSVDNSGYMDIDGTRIIDLSNVTNSSPYRDQVSAYLNDHAITKSLTEGWKTVNLFYKNWGGPHSVAATISYQGRLIWTSRMAYNAQEYADCSASSKPSPKLPCDNPVSTKVYSFVGNVDHTLRITIKGQSATYSNEQYHGYIQKNSTFFNDGLDQINTQLTLKTLQGRGNVTITQQPASSNNYTALIDIFDPSGGEGSYSFELYQLKCPTTPIRKELSETSGGGCPAVWQLMETKELGVIEARHIKVGMHLRDSVPGVWNRVNVAYIDVAPIYRVDIGGQVFDVDHSHKWYLGNDQWVKVTDIKAGDFVKTTEGTNVMVNSVHYLRDDQYMHMNVDNQRYVMGTNIIGHNATSSFLARKF